MITVLPCAPVETAPIAPPTLTTADGAHALPLVGLDQHLDVTGLAYELTATQVFANSLTSPLEAVYVFPLPPAGAVVEMVARFAGREVRAVLDRREAARATYEQAIALGQQAALLEEDRPSTFTMTVGNIPAGASVEIRIVVVGTLDLVALPAGLAARLRLPSVVAPRYTAGTPLAGPSAGDGTALDTDAVPDASRVTPPVAADPSLAPSMTWSATFDPAGLAVASVRCTTHAVATTREGDVVELRHDAAVADRDVAFELLLAPAAPVAGAVWSRDHAPDERLPGGASALVTIVPPADLAAHRTGRDVVVLVDRSGSMDGWKMPGAIDATTRLLAKLDATDRVAVAAFDTVLEPLTPGLVELGPNRAAIERGLSLVGARGGTELAPALAWAVELLASSAGRRRTIVVVSDAQVSGEDAALRALGGDDGAGLPRLVLLGVDASANLGLLHRLAARTGGATEIVDAPNGIAAAVDVLGTYLGDPVIEDLRVTGDGDLVVAPGILPPAFAGVPVRIAVRAGAPGPLTVSGRLADGTVWSRQLAPITIDGHGPRWAFGRARVRDLEDAWAAGDDVSLDAIVDVALACGVLCRHTAFVAVDTTGPTVGEPSRTVVQPVALPAGWPQQQSLAGFVGGLGAAGGPPPAGAMPAAPAPMSATSAMLGGGGGVPRHRSLAKMMRHDAAGARPMPPQAEAAPKAPPTGQTSARPPLDLVLDEIEQASADLAAVPDAAQRARWARTLRAESRSAGLLGRRRALSTALRDLAEAITRWDDPAARGRVVAALAAVRTALAAS